MNARATIRGAAGLALALALSGATLRAQETTEERMTSPAVGTADYDENGQARKLPSLPDGMTLDMIRQGDSLFRTAGGCQTCHGQDAQGMPAMGSAITSGMNFIPNQWAVIDSLITAGIPEPVTRTPIAMPARGAQSNLTPEQSRLIAAYVWAISRVQGEPWQGGHRTHGTPSAQQAGDTGRQSTSSR